MHWLLVAYTVYFNRRHRSSGHLFQGRYKSFLVQEGDYLLGLSRYVHLNPVRGVSLGRGTPSERRKRLRAFKWSSYRGYAGLSAPFPFVQEAMVLDELRGPGVADSSSKNAASFSSASTTKRFPSVRIALESPVIAFSKTLLAFSGPPCYNGGYGKPCY
jgi:hypothetical protein